MKKVYAVRTRYPHMGKYTGFNRFLIHIDPARVGVKEKLVPMWNPSWAKPGFKRLLKDNIRMVSSSVYRPNDLLAEISTFSHSLFRSPDIVHLFDAEHSLKYLPIWFKRFAGLKRFPKIIAMLHQPPEILDELLDPKTLAMTDCILVVSPDQKEYIEGRLPGLRVELLPLPVDTDHFAPGPQGKSNRRFLCLAGGVWLRDYGALVETARLLKDDARFEFHIVTRALKVPEELNNIVLHSGITDQEFLSLYRISDILFMPMESATANNVIMEGISCGLPVLTSDLPSIRYYLPGTEAVLIKDNDPDAFARALVELSGDPHWLSRMSQSARKRALELSWKRVIRGYEDLYLSL